MNEDGKPPRRWATFGVMVSAILIPLLAVLGSVVITTKNSTTKNSPAPLPAAIPAATAPRLDPCLLGRWHQVTGLHDEIDLNNGEVIKPVTREGFVSWLFRQDGQGHIEFTTRLAGTRISDGVHIEQLFGGRDTFTYAVANETITFAAISDQATSSTSIDGRQVAITAENAGYVSARFTCTASRLTFSLGTGGTIELDRA